LFDDSGEALRGWVLSSELLARFVVKLKSAICSRDAWWAGGKQRPA
jgi:hypothetical protein